MPLKRFRKRLKKRVKRFRKNLKKKFYDMVFEQDSPHWIALSFSIGLFFGFIPLLGLQFFPMLLLMFAAKLNKAATLVGHLLLNTFTFPITYAFCFVVGTRILGEDVGILFNPKGITWAYLVEIYKPLFIGCMVVGLICSVIAYFIVRKIVYSYRHAHYEREKIEKIANEKKKSRKSGKARKSRKKLSNT